MSKNIKYKAIIIGTSAGGLYALSDILGGIPENYPLPIIVIQHRSKDAGDLLEEVLQSKCKITIKQADEKEKITGSVVYIAPPDYHLLIENDYTFSLTKDEYVHYSRPSIDVSFESAAYVYKENLAGIILTGSNSDGAAGIEIVHHYDGLTIAQDPNEAQFSQMPIASINTKKIDRVLKLKEIQKFLLEIVNEKK